MRRPDGSLVIDTVLGLRTSALAWIVGGSVVMYGMTLAIATELADFPGGAAAAAAQVTAGAEAMRILRWPAERLDTLGGYATYHNVIFIGYFLVLYAAVQGAKAIRGGEERHSLDELLATGVPRSRVILARAVGFAILLAVVALALGLGLAAAMGQSGEGDLTGSLITTAASGSAALVGYGLGLVVGQLCADTRAAAGIAGVLVTAQYVVTNLGDTLGRLAFLQYLSPFTGANRSRALVPGYGFDPWATLLLLGCAVVLIAGAGWAFARRDIGGVLWPRRPAPAHLRPVRRTTASVPTVLLGSVTTATLRRTRFGLLAWALGAASLTALMAGLQPSVMEVWTDFDFVDAITGAGPGVDAQTAYWSFAGALISPVIAAYVVVQASAWTTELAQGRVELLLAAPVSWTRLVLGRLLALVVGVLAITLTGLAALLAVAAAIDGRVDLAGLGRLTVIGVLFGAALGAVGALLVVVVRRALAVTVLASVVVASYLLAYLVPMFGWPEWLDRLSVFWAFGQPYLQWPSGAMLATLLVVAIPGAAAAAALAERTPKVA